MSSDLADRVEGLQGPCRETDVLIVQAMHPDIGPCEPHCAGEEPIFWNDPLYKRPCPPLTASLDAVVALIEKELPGWSWGVGTHRAKHAAVIGKNDKGSPIEASGTTAALALLAALLRAKEADHG